MTAIRDFTVDVPQAALDDLDERLGRTRFPEAATAEGWDQGVPRAYLRDLVDTWRTDYDWRHCETALNAYPNHLVAIDGLDIHFLHVRSPEAGARPLLMTHGWPGSVLEFIDVIGPLTDPAAHGGAAEDAFHLILPSLPGYGFSGKPEAAGWGVEKIAEAWHALMRALGYDAWFAQGGDWGAAVTAMIGSQNLGGCRGIHTNLLAAAPPKEVLQTPTEDEQAALARLQWYRDTEAGYSTQQRTRPQTLGYALADSPAGQLAWIVEKFMTWSDCDGHPENVFSRTALLDTASLYWLTNSGASSARLYWESFASAPTPPVEIPAGFSAFPKELMTGSRRWAESRFTDLVYWNRLDKGGHFAAMERPALFVAELRACFATMAL